MRTWNPKKLKIIFKRDTLDNYKKHNYIPDKNEFLFVDMPNGECKCVIGDGKHYVAGCKRFTGLTPVIRYRDNKFYIGDEENE